LVTSRNQALGEAFVLEVAAATSDGARRVCDGVYVADAAPRSRLARMLSLRCEMVCLAVADSPLELVDRISELNWAADTRLDGLSWELFHERRFDGGVAHVPSPEMHRLVRQACGRDSMPIARGACKETSLRLVVLETASGCVFAVVTYAPASSASIETAWVQKPHNYSAGLPMGLARLAVNLATELQPQSLSIADPCCGSGSILFAASCVGAKAVRGVELQRAVAQMCRGNLAATRQVADAERRRIASEAAEDCGGPGEIDVVHADAMDVELRCDVMVSNLPFGNWVAVGGKREGLALGVSHNAELPRLLGTLRGQATRHAFFSGEEGLGTELSRLGYQGVREVCVDAVGRRWLTLACDTGG
jgi:hypothetical protein